MTISQVEDGQETVHISQGKKKELTPKPNQKRVARSEISRHVA